MNEIADTNLWATFRVQKGERSYEISMIQDKDWPLWLESGPGEGMGMSAYDLFDMLDEYFKANF